MNKGRESLEKSDWNRSFGIFIGKGTVRAEGMRPAVPGPESTMKTQVIETEVCWTISGCSGATVVAAVFDTERVTRMLEDMMEGLRYAGMVVVWLKKRLKIPHHVTLDFTLKEMKYLEYLESDDELTTEK